MERRLHADDRPFGEEEEIVEPMLFEFGLKRRVFVQLVATGLLVAAAPLPSLAQSRGGGRRGGGEGYSASARVHIGKDGMVTVLTGKVEVGQGSRAEFTQAAAEELRLPVGQIQMVMGDTEVVPNDGLTAGSGSTPRTLPSIRQAAAMAREVLLALAAERWNVDASAIVLDAGRLTHQASNRTVTYGELAQTEGWPKAMEQPASGAKLTETSSWKILGTTVARPNARDIVAGKHRYSSDVSRPEMLRGKVLRPPTFGARLTAVDLAPARAMPGVIVVRDGDFVGVCAPTTYLARQALEAVARTATWESRPHPSSKQVYTYLRERVSGGVPKNPFDDAVTTAKKSLEASYRTAYIQHAPMETRAAVAEWHDGKLTVWAGTQNPFGYRSELARAFRLSEEKVRVVVPDTGGGFGGKHTGEAAVEAARLAQAAGQPVSVKWTREEEFTWASFRPAAVMDAVATLDEAGRMASWYFVNINAGGAAVDSPYRVEKKFTRAVNSDPPLRHGSYRALAATANNFARESFMDELAAAAGLDPLEFRLAHLEPGRLRDVLDTAAKRFNWTERSKEKSRSRGVGLACGTEKGSYVAACVEVEIDRERRRIIPRQVCEVFECGAVINPGNLQAQIEGAIIMGLGPALREAMRFENGQMLNAGFGEYEVPRLEDMPALDIHILNRPDLPSVGGGETPIIAIAPAIGNAVYQATGLRLREMPLRLPEKLPS